MGLCTLANAGHPCPPPGGLAHGPANHGHKYAPRGGKQPTNQPHKYAPRGGKDAARVPATTGIEILGRSIIPARFLKRGKYSHVTWLGGNKAKY